MKFFVAAAAAFTVASGINVDFETVQRELGDERILSIPFNQLNEKVGEVLKKHQADEHGFVDESLDLKISLDGLKELTEMGVKVNDKTKEYIEYHEKLFSEPNMFCEDGPEQCAARSLQDFYSSFHTLETYENRFKNTVASSDLATIRVLGESYEGRDIYVIEIGDMSKPVGFVFCNVHAREWLTPAFCTYAVETLVANGGHPILDDMAVAVVPVGNPDGYKESYDGRDTQDRRMWRKTRKPNPNNNCIGTDINRNWDNEHCGVGSSTNPCRDTYCGRAPFDQQETALLDQYARSLGSQVKASLDVHSYGSYILYPYGYTPVPPPEPDFTNMKDCARAGTDGATAVSGASWRSGTTPELLGYNSGGTSKDYMYGNLGIVYAYTIEMRGRSFFPPANQIDIANRETFGLIEGILECIAEKANTPPSPAPPPVPTPTPQPTPGCTGWFC